MAAEAGGIVVTDATEARRYEARLKGALAGFLDYRRRSGNQIVLVHTEVDPAFEGRGVGGGLARFALEDARRRGLDVVPRCPFVVAFLKRHPEYQDVVSTERGVCEHMDEVRDVTPSANGCEDCLRIGGTWLHLRLCRTCGHVGCCDSSPNRHASAHARETGHPVVTSLEPGEGWSWCYVDEILVEGV